MAPSSSQPAKPEALQQDSTSQSLASQGLASKDLTLAELSFADLEGFAEDDHLEAFRVFRLSGAALVEDRPVLRQGVAPSPALKAICRLALDQTPGDRIQARRFFEEHFRPFGVRATRGSNGHAAGFLTGYYEPVVEGSLTRTADFTAPILARPDDLPPSAGGASAGPTPYPDRAAIEAGAITGRARPIVWLRDAIEVFLIQVQGSARVRLADGGLLRLVYAGRNGQPYTSIGRLLIEAGEIAETDMSLARLKAWVRDHGQEPGEAGRALMQRNRSYVFFARDEKLDLAASPIGGQGVSLTPLRSIAIDRTIWPYGLPVWIAADLPWASASASPFRRLMVAQDTGSAIVGPARADIFFGAGDDAGARAGDIRNVGDFVVFLPAGESSPR
ncbi:MltA domain-containing protein [Methylocapsa polymorpha]|uniref:peptidoglycan lytic exotransglycosylase n=1 Tax=Methylocapsa polymorpha TaxID=3080828 RepID=A0ABZ0HS93_9HYPH|nr:MltA domain-containing protein [Methylocapsa sp. RX1]